MTPMSRDDLQKLLRVTGELSVSIFLPTERCGAETQQNPIRFKNLLREAERQLAEHGSEEHATDELLAPLRARVDDYGFWQHQSDGLAIFRSRDLYKELLLPISFRESCVVNDRFYLKPLFPVLQGDARFYVLAVSLHLVRLFAASRYDVREVELGPEVPHSLAEVVGEEIVEQHLQYHSGHTKQQAGGAPVYHGQGGGEDDQKEEIRRFLHRVDQAVQGYLDDRGIPLVLAAVEYLQALYRAGSGYPALVPQGVAGNPEKLRPEELRDRAWEVVRPLLLARREEDSKRFAELSGAGRASHRLEVVLPAAFEGRVETLFVARDERRWGRFDEANREVQLFEGQEPGSDDLLDLAAVRTFMNGGTVYSLEVEKLPATGQPVAAIFRY